MRVIVYCNIYLQFPSLFSPYNVKLNISLKKEYYISGLHTSLVLVYLSGIAITKLAILPFLYYMYCKEFVEN